LAKIATDQTSSGERHGAWFSPERIPVDPHDTRESLRADWRAALRRIDFDEDGHPVADSRHRELILLSMFGDFSRAPLPRFFFIAFSFR